MKSKVSGLFISGKPLFKTSIPSDTKIEGEYEKPQSFSKPLLGPQNGCSPFIWQFIINFILFCLKTSIKLFSSINLVHGL